MWGSDMLAAVVSRCARHARSVVLFYLLLAVAGAFYASSHLGVTTDTEKLFSDKLPWKQQELTYERLFPQFNDLLVVVIDAAIPEEAEETAAALAASLTADKHVFRSIRRPDASPFLQREGLLYLPTGDLEHFLDQTTDSQPFIGQLVADPSARGILSALSLVALGSPTARPTRASSVRSSPASRPACETLPPASTRRSPGRTCSADRSPSRRDGSSSCSSRPISTTRRSRPAVPPPTRSGRQRAPSRSCSRAWRACGSPATWPSRTRNSPPSPRAQSRA